MINFEEQIESEIIPGIYGDRALLLFSDISQIKKEIDEAFLVEAALLVCIKKGHAQVTIDNEVCDFYEGDLFCCRPNVVFNRGLVSFDTELSALLISPQYAFDIVRKTGIEWSFTIWMQKHGSIHLTAPQMSSLLTFLSLLDYYIKEEETKYKSKKIDSLMITLIYSIKDFLCTQEQNEHELSFSPKENLMERFIMLLKEVDPKKDNQHYMTVKQYADKLNVSAKYFSTVCKNYLGKTAGEIIDEQIIESAKILLQDNNYNIKQISDKLGFANQSHFGTFFRRHTGISPMQYRKE